MKMKNLLIKGWPLLVLVIFILLRLPSLFEPFTYGDEGIYLTLGQAARKGLVWYRDIHDNKPPMLYLITALAGNFTTYRLIHFFWSLITVLAFWQLAKLVFSKNKLAEVISTIVFTILTSLHTFEGNVANAENFMMLPTIAGFYLIYEMLSEKISTRKNLVINNWPLFLAGFLFGIATLFKVPAVFDFAAALVFMFLIFSGQKNKNSLLFALRSLLLLIGFLLPILLTTIYYASKDAFKPYLIAAFFQNLPYLSSWGSDKPQAGGLPIMLLGRGFLVFFLVAFIFVFRQKLKKEIGLILIWFTFSWFATLLSARPYPHYLIQILPSFSLSFGLLAIKSRKQWKKLLLPLSLILVFGATFALFHFWNYPNRSYYLNFYRFALGLKTKQQYFLDFDSQSLNIYQTANYIKQRTFSEEKIFIWGTQPSIYSMANRLPVGRYTSSYHIIDFNGYEETIQALNSNPPRYLLTCDDEKRPFPKLFDLIRNHYAFEKQIDQIKIFHLIENIYF